MKKSQLFTLIGIVAVTSFARADTSTTATPAPVSFGTASPGVNMAAITSIPANNTCKAQGASTGWAAILDAFKKKHPLSDKAHDAGGSCPADSNSALALNPATCSVNVDFTSISCSDIEINGVVSSCKVDKDMARWNCATDAVAKKQSDLNDVQNQICLLGVSAAQIAAQMAAAKTQFDTILNGNPPSNTITGATQIVKNYQTAETGLDQQITQLQQKLNGGGGAGATGLLAQQQATEGMIGQMSGQIQQVVDLHTNLDQQTQILQQQEVNQKMAAANTCFNKQTQPGYLCASSGPAGTPTDANDYVTCRLQQSWVVSSNGIIQTDADSQASATAEVAKLQSILSAIQSNSPQTGAIPGAGSTPEQVAATQNQPNSILTAADIQSQYGAQLAQIDSDLTAQTGKSLGIANFVTQSYAYCFSQANAQVQRDLNTPNTSLWLAATAITTNRNKIKQLVQPMLTAFGEMISKNRAALDGSSQAVSIAPNCSDPTQAAEQISCLNQLHDQLNAQLLGTADSPLLSIPFVGNPFIPAQNIACRGLNGCIAQLTTLNTTLANNKTATHTAEQTFVASVNTQIKTAVGQLAAYYTAPALALKKQIDTIESKLATLSGGSSGGGLGIQPVTPIMKITDICPPAQAGYGGKPGDEQLCSSPDSTFNLIASMTVPPMPNIVGMSLNTDAVGTAQTKIDGFNDTLGKSADNLSALQTSCNITAARPLFTKLQGELGLYEGCAAIQGWCQKNEGDPFSQLTSAIAGITPPVGGPAGFSSADVSALSTGLTNACDPSGGSCTLVCMVQSYNGDGGRAINGTMALQERNQCLDKELIPVPPPLNSPNKLETYWALPTTCITATAGASKAAICNASQITIKSDANQISNLLNNKSGGGK